MITDTSEAVNEAIEVLREQIQSIRKELEAAPSGVVIGDDGKVSSPRSMLRGQLCELTDRLAVVENNRLQVMIAFVAGRRGLDKIPAIELDLMVRAIAGRKETPIP